MHTLSFSILTSRILNIIGTSEILRKKHRHIQTCRCFRKEVKSGKDYKCVKEILKNTLFLANYVDIYHRIFREGMTNMTVLQCFELVYYGSFIILTALIVEYTVKNYLEQKRQPPKLIARVNYLFLKKTNGQIPVALDIINVGDYAAEKVYIDFAVKHKSPESLDCINFIAPKENFEFFLGMWTDSEVELFDGKRIKLQDPLDYDYFKLEIQEVPPADNTKKAKSAKIVLTISGDEIRSSTVRYK